VADKVLYKSKFTLHWTWQSRMPPLNYCNLRQLDLVPWWQWCSVCTPVARLANSVSPHGLVSPFLLWSAFSPTAMHAGICHFSARLQDFDNIILIYEVLLLCATYNNEQKNRLPHTPDPSQSRPVLRQSEQSQLVACWPHSALSSSCRESSTHSHACPSGYGGYHLDRSTITSS